MKIYNTKVCKECKQLMSWENQKHQFGRLVRKGYAIEQIRSMLPQCGKCTTAWMKNNAPSPKVDLSSDLGQLSSDYVAT